MSIFDKLSTTPLGYGSQPYLALATKSVPSQQEITRKATDNNDIYTGSGVAIPTGPTALLNESYSDTVIPESKQDIATQPVTKKQNLMFYAYLIGGALAAYYFLRKGK